MNDRDNPSNPIEAHVDDALIELMDLLQAIDDSEGKIKLNKDSIRDNNGGRILF